MDIADKNPGVFERDYLVEAHNIIAGTTLLIPERIHLLALNNAFQSKIAALEAALTDDQYTRQEVAIINGRNS